MRLIVNGKEIQAECGRKLSAYLHTDSPCGGKGKCGKCKVVARGGISPITEQEKSFLTPDEFEHGIRLACMAEVVGDAEIYTLGETDGIIAVDGAQAEYALHTRIKRYGMAVDIGTTTVVVGVYDRFGNLSGKRGLSTRKRLMARTSFRASKNPSQAREKNCKG